MRSFAFRKAKEEVNTENLRLRVTKTVCVFEKEEWESPAAPFLPVAKSKSKRKGKERKGRGSRSMSTNPASAEQPSDPGSGPKRAAEEQHWVPLFNTIPVVSTLVSSHVSLNSCAPLRQRMCRRQCQERDVARCLESLNWLAGHETGYHTSSFQTTPRSLFLQAAFRELLGSHLVYGLYENGNLANFSTVGPVSLPDSLMLCLRACATIWRIFRA